MQVQTYAESFVFVHSELAGQEFESHGSENKDRQGVYAKCTEFRHIHSQLYYFKSHLVYHLVCEICRSLNYTVTFIGCCIILVIIQRGYILASSGVGQDMIADHYPIYILLRKTHEMTRVLHIFTAEAIKIITNRSFKTSL